MAKRKKNTSDDVREYELRSIDAWRDDGGWYWNASYMLEDGIYLSDDSLTSRKLFRFLRRNGWLTPQSKGMVALHDDWPLLEIQLKATQEPILALIAKEG